MAGFAALSLLATTDFVEADPVSADWVGDYAGWAYTEDGGDFPFRMHCTATAGGLGVTFDVPHQRAFDLTTSGVRVDENSLRFERRNANGRLWTYEWSREGKNELSGRASLDGAPTFVVELHRSAEPLRNVPPDSYADCVGIYRCGGGRTIVVSAWFWGELRYFDTTSGQSRTLFALSDEDFFAGAAMYVPTSVDARLHFARSGSEGVTRMIWNPEGAASETCIRFEPVDKPVSFANGDIHLRGTLVKPPGRGTFPAIVVLGGSDWNLRDHVRREADIFASMGLASLIYDKRGHGKSSGDGLCSFDETASDVCAAVAALQKRSDVRADRIGIFGRSRGGWFAPLAASKCHEAAFLVLFVPPAVSPARQETTRRLHEMRAAGFSEEEVEAGRKYLELLWRAGDSEDAWNRYAAARESVKVKGWIPYLDGLDARDSDDAKWIRMNMSYDPIPALEHVTCPVLALFGESDNNVTPADNVDPMERALRRAGNHDVTLKVLPRADHGLRPVDPSQPPPPLHRSTGYVPQVWTTVRKWLETHGFVAES